jgi:hypothetical protein
MLLRRILFIFSSILLCITGQLHAQITSSGLIGIVTDDSSKALAGATIRAIHQPSGTVYSTTSATNGSFNIQNMRVGGPYLITVNYSGFKTWTFDEVYLTLGENYFINAKLGGEELKEVVVKSFKDPLFNSQRTGAAREISNYELSVLPSTGRTVSDFTRLTPQSSGGNFMGRDSRYNNFQVNGANYNNSFGLSSSFPGGAQAFSLEAVDQVQVAISPFDARQSNFTGANVNIITKSGTNEYHGSVYDYFRNQTYQGTHVGSDTLPTAQKVRSNIQGFTASGPIIKNKLFFFINGEIDKTTSPGFTTNWVATAPGVVSPSISRTPAADLLAVSNFVKSKYGYETGPYQDWANNFKTQNNRFLARIDWNLNEKNKFNFSVTQLNRSSDQLPSSKSVSGTPTNNNSRIGSNSLAFANSMYRNTDVVTALSGEWLHTIKSNISNQLLVSYTHVRDTRSSPSSQFPFVDILNNGSTTSQSDNYMSLGYELFSYKNDLIYNTTSVYDNLSMTKGIHNITAGVSFQYLSIANSFFPNGTLYYKYFSVNDFISGNTPGAFGYSYAFDGQDGYIRVKYGLGGAYLQDKVNITPKLTLTGGVRIDMPFYLNKLTDNPNIDTLRFYGPDGNRHTQDVSKWPDAKPIVAPRIAFNWSPLDNKKLQVRGGTGIFLGQVPFVWFTNQPGSAGVYTNNIQITADSTLRRIPFATSPSQLPESIRAQYLPSKPSNGVPSTLAFVDRNFKMPRVMRTDLAADYRLPWYGLVASVEAIYTKDIYSVYQYNGNLPLPTGTQKVLDSNGKVNVNSADSLRPYYSTNNLYGQSVSNFKAAYILENSKKGEAYSFTVGLTKSPHNGVFGSLHYTYMSAKDVSPNGGSQAGSAWSSTPNFGSPNNVQLSYSDYYVPHRVIGSLSYRFEYLKHAATTVSLVYEGSAGGRYSYNYRNDVSNDGQFNDLMYIPKNASELNWADLKDINSGKIIFTKAQEIAAFDSFMNQDRYLNSHRGQYAQRNGAQMPYYGSFDFKLIQDLFYVYKKRKYGFQFTCDILNIGNLLNNNWGVHKRLLTNTPLAPGFSSKGIDAYRSYTVLDNYGHTVLPTHTFVNNITPGSVWSMQLGLRVTF